MPFITSVKLVHDVPEKEIVDQLLSQGMSIVGGFPLWLMGGASFASDIDVYVHSKDQHRFASNLLNKVGKFDRVTPKTIVYKVNDTYFQLVNFIEKFKLLQDILYTTDLSPSACALVKVENEYRVQCLYYDDIQKRVCRVLIAHNWTMHRIFTYQERGYNQFIWEDYLGIYM